MKVSFFQEKNIVEDHVDVYYREMNEEIEGIAHFFEQKNIIYARDDSSSVQVHLSEIYYMEVIDRKSFIYLKDKVLQIEYSLRDFIAFLGNHTSFVQIEKSVVVNIDHIEKITPDVNMRMNLTMESKDKLVVNRGFKKAFMECLKKRSKETCKS